MKIEHIAIWTNDIEKMKRFYLKFFKLKANEKYYNPKKEFSSYFLSFDTGARIELMHKPEIEKSFAELRTVLGLTHFAISLGSKIQVDQLTNQIGKEGYKIIGKPRTTGDGYYESVIEDPEGNLIELTD